MRIKLAMRKRNREPKEAKKEQQTGQREGVAERGAGRERGESLHTPACQQLQAAEGARMPGRHSLAQQWGPGFFSTE